MAAIGFDYYSVGYQTGNLVVRILNGARPGTIPVAGVEHTFLHVNPGMAEKMGVSIPQDVVDRADLVVE